MISFDKLPIQNIKNIIQKDMDKINKLEDILGTDLTHSNATNIGDGYQIIVYIDKNNPNKDNILSKLPANISGIPVLFIYMDKSQYDKKLKDHFPGSITIKKYDGLDEIVNIEKENQNVEMIKNLTRDARDKIHQIPGVTSTSITHSRVTGIGNYYQIKVTLENEYYDNVKYLPDKISINGEKIDVIYSIAPPGFKVRPLAIIQAGQSMSPLGSLVCGNYCGNCDITGGCYDCCWGRCFDYDICSECGGSWVNPWYRLCSWACTAGAIVKKDDQYYMLTCHHCVDWCEEMGTSCPDLGKDIYTPAPMDISSTWSCSTGCNIVPPPDSSYIMGKVTYIHPWNIWGTSPNQYSKVDGALVSTPNGWNAITPCGWRAGPSIDPVIGMEIKKSGRSTGCTSATIYGLDSKVTLPGFSYTYWEDMIETDTRNYVLPGDSGSITVEYYTNATIGINNLALTNYSGTYAYATYMCKAKNIESEMGVIFGEYPSCTPNWQCIQPLDGYEHDINNCGEVDRLNSACNPLCTPDWQCVIPLDGYEHDINNCPGSIDRLNPACNPICTPNWQCEIPLNGYENDINNCPGSIDRLNPACNPICTPNWQCEIPLNGYENDGCGNRRLNTACNPICTPNWQCEIPLNGYEYDINNCGSPRRLNMACNPPTDCCTVTYT